MTTYVTHLESAIDGSKHPADRPQTMHAGRPFWVRYDLDAIKAAVKRDDLAGREASMWRYRELLPPADDSHIVSLGEGMSPVLPCPRLGDEFGLTKLYVKDESQLPTGSFKARGIAMAVTMCNQFGLGRLVIPTAGNAGGAMAAYAARAGMEAYVFMPTDTPAVNRAECVLAGAHTYLVDGLITDCGRIVKDGMEHMHWFDVSTLKEPYRIEGKKTLGLELAEQFNWKLPDVIVYPTGGGTGLIGMWKAFEELAALGWLDSDKRPRMVSVQSDGCCPIVRAFDAGEKHATPFENAATIASGLRVPAAVGDFMILDAVRASGGTAVAVEEGRIREWMDRAVRAEGISICPEAAACVGAVELLAEREWIKPNESVVLFNTGAAQKYLEGDIYPAERISVDDVPWRRLAPAQA